MQWYAEPESIEFGREYHVRPPHVTCSKVRYDQFSKIDGVKRRHSIEQPRRKDEDADCVSIFLNTGSLLHAIEQLKFW
jgi:hypothetical protein